SIHGVSPIVSYTLSLHDAPPIFLALPEALPHKIARLHKPQSIYIDRKLGLPVSMLVSPPEPRRVNSLQFFKRRKRKHKHISQSDSRQRTATDASRADRVGARNQSLVLTRPQ